MGVTMRLAQIEDGVVVNVIEVDPAALPDWAQGWPEAGAAGPGWSWDGEVFTPPPPPDPAEARTAAIARVNAQAGQVRLKVYTDIPGQDALYLEKRAEAQAFVANPQTSDLADFPLIAAEVGPGLTADTPYELAQIWLNRSHLFKLVGGATERARLRAAYAIAAAPDEDAIIAIEQDFVEALSQLPI